MSGTISSYGGGNGAMPSASPGEAGKSVGTTSPTGSALRSAGKAQRNKAHHQKLKTLQDHVLLRLQKGDRSRFDAGAMACGLSRAAFAQLYLVPMAEALSKERIAKLAVLGARRRLGVAALLGWLIDDAQIPLIPDPGTALDLSSEFDELFNSQP